MKNFEGSSRSTSPGCSVTSVELDDAAQINAPTLSPTEMLEEVACLEKYEKLGRAARTSNFEGSSRSTSPGCSTNAPSSPTLSHTKTFDLEPMYVLLENTCIFSKVDHVRMQEVALDVQGPAFVQLAWTHKASQDFELTTPPNLYNDSNAHATRTRTWVGASSPMQPPCDASFASVGSMQHFKGSCKPCAFVHTVGCANGDRCAHCHLCPPGEKLRRRRLFRFAAKQFCQ